jgi:DNA-binding transcriptional regulator PaaX
MRLSHSPQISDEEMATLTRWVQYLVSKSPQNEKELSKAIAVLRKQDRCIFKKSRLGQVYHLLVKQGKIFKNERLRQLLVKKAQKSQSGVLVVTVLTSP